MERGAVRTCSQYLIFKNIVSTMEMEYEPHFFSKAVPFDALGVIIPKVSSKRRKSYGHRKNVQDVGTVKRFVLKNPFEWNRVFLYWSPKNVWAAGNV